MYDGFELHDNKSLDNQVDSLPWNFHAPVGDTHRSLLFEPYLLRIQFQTQGRAVDRFKETGAEHAMNGDGATNRPVHHTLGFQRQRRRHPNAGSVSRFFFERFDLFVPFVFIVISGR